jgi:hypothetical protein
LVRYAGKPRIPEDTSDEPDISLLGGVETQDGVGLPEKARRKIWIADSQNKALWVLFKLALIDFP